MPINLLRFLLLTFTIALLMPIAKATDTCSTNSTVDQARSACLSQTGNNPNFPCTSQGINSACATNPAIIGNVCFTSSIGSLRCQGYTQPPNDLCTGTDIYNLTTFQCEPDTTNCNIPAGTLTWGGYGSNPGDTICISNCKHTRINSNFGLTITNNITDAFYNNARYSSTGVACDQTEDTPDTPTNTTVTDTDFDGIPEIAGNELPATEAPPNGCILGSDGSILCGGSTPTPPRPDNGTPGVGASPDQTITNNNSNTTTNYFGSGTVAGSSSGVPDGQDEGVCDPAVEQCGESTNAADNGCGALPDCSGDPIQCVMLKMQHDTRCNLQDETEDITEADVMSQLGVNKTLEDYVADELADPNNTIDFNDDINIPTPGNSSCPADINVTLSMGAMTLPTTPICDFAILVRPFILAFSYLLATLMFFNGVIRL